MGRLILPLALALALPLSGQAQVLRGRVIEDATDRAIANARLELIDANEQVIDFAVSDSTGAFRLAAELAGRYRVRARSQGHADATSPPIELELGVHLDVRFVMAPEVVLLAPLEVVAKSRPLIAGMTLAAFHERRAKGLGYALTYEDFKNQNPRAVSDLLRQIPGVRVIWSFGSSSIEIAGQGRLETSCPVLVMLDGTEFRWGASTIDDIPVHDIYAIEVFRSLASLPIEFASRDARCGVIAIWTKRGVG